MRRFRIALVAVPLLLWVGAGIGSAQRGKDTTRVDNREFLRLLKKAEELDEEQKLRAKRTINPRILSRLAVDEDAGVRFYVAFNPHTPTEPLLELSRDASQSVRWAVAMNQNLPQESMYSLAVDYVEIVRMGLASNPKVVPEVLRNLAGDISRSVRRKVAYNPSTDPLILQILSKGLRSGGPSGHREEPEHAAVGHGGVLRQRRRLLPSRCGRQHGHLAGHPPGADFRYES